MPCTTILVGKKLSYDGSTLVARNEDSGAGSYMPKKFVVVKPENQPKLYKSVISHVEIPLFDKPMRYTAMPNAVNNEGLWSACGVNEANVSMTATETITSNERVLSADPLVKYVPAKGVEGLENYVPEQIGGIGEEDIVTLVLPYINSARDGVLRLANLLETCGTYEMNGIAFQDKDEIWWFETIGGHHWIARRVPDDCYVVAPNSFNIDYFDFDDAFCDKEYHMCSEDMIDFVKKNNLDLGIDGKFNARYAFGSHSDSDHVYNTPRTWIAQKYFSKKILADRSDFEPYSDTLDWALHADRKICVEDIKYVLSNHYQGTDYDPYSVHSDPIKKGSFRPIGVNRTNFMSLVQINGNKSDATKAVQWVCFGSNVHNALVPFYPNINNTPKYLSCTDATVSTDSFYWANRLIAALSDSVFSKAIPHIERYQLAVQTKGHEIIKKYDELIEDMDYNKACVFCEQANAEIEEMLKVATDDLLSKVLIESSNEMKNSFSRSDA